MPDQRIEPPNRPAVQFSRRLLLSGGLAMFAGCGRHSGPCTAACRPSPSGASPNSDTGGPTTTPRPTRSPSSASLTLLAFDRALAAFEASPDATDDLANDTGLLTWSQSYVLLALVRVYQATGRVSYLERFAQRADRTLELTDQARGVTDYRGRSGPVWRAAGTYTAGRTVLMSSSSAPIVDLRYAGPDGASATVAVSPGSRPTTFTLTLEHPSSSPIRVINVSTNPAHSRYVERAVLQEAYHPSTPWTARVVGSGVPVPGSSVIRPAYNVFAVSTGMITYPLALYVRTVREDATLRSTPHQARSERVLEAIRAAVAFHDPEWSDHVGGAAGYTAPRGAPVARDGNFLPFNQSNALGQTLSELYRVTGSVDYADRVTKLARAWRASLRPQPAGGVRWPYWPPFSKVYTGYTAAEHISSYTPMMPPTQQLDDISHGAITVEFATAAQQAGIGFTDRDRNLLIRTYLDQLISGSASVRSRFGGPNAAAPLSLQSARWLELGDRRIARHVDLIMRADKPASINGASVLGYGYLAWAAARGLL